MHKTTLRHNINTERVTRANPPATNGHQQHEPNQQSPQTRPSNKSRARHHPQGSHPQNLFAPLHSSLRDLNTGVPDVSHVQPPSAAYLSAPSQSEARTGTVSSPVDSQPPPRTSAAASHAGLGCTKVVLAPGRSGREGKSTCCFVSIYARSFVTIHETISL